MLKLKIVFCVSFSIFIFFGLVKNSEAATYYVSPNGNANWNECTDISLPCKLTTALTNAIADDIVYLRSGIYDIAQITGTACTYSFKASHISPANSGINGHPIIFKAYENETPIFNDTLGAGQTRCSIFGLYGNYTIIDGVHFQANNGTKLGYVYIVGASAGNPAIGNTFINCDFNGGTDILPAGGTNFEMIRPENTSGTKIQNSKIYNVNCADGDANTSAIKLYHNENFLFENNEIYNSNVGFYDKSYSADMIVRYNYIHNCNVGVRLENSGYGQFRSKFYNNVFANNNSKCFYGKNDMAHADENAEFYNNTFYHTVSDQNLLYMTPGSGYRVYNNIFYGGNGNNTYGSVQDIVLSSNAAISSHTTLAECDYNLYGRIRIYDQYTTTRYTEQSQWSASTIENGLHPDQNSIVGNPQFVNVSGSMNDLADFALQTDSPCKGTGKNGADMGADVSLVGIKNSSITDALSPSAPSGLSVR